MKLYGKAKLKGGKWLIAAEPHVMIRLKRVFGSLGKAHRGVVSLTDTLDVCRELAWFMGRYPLDVDPLDYLEQRSREHRQRESLVEQILHGTIDPRAFDLALPAREYQTRAANLALATRGLLLADDVGLGKTATAICMLTEARTRPALVVCPPHLQRQWREEIRKFAPSLECHILKKGTPYDYTSRRRREPAQLELVKSHPDVLISTYHKLAGWAETLSPIVKSVIFDEVHELRRGNDSEKGVAAQAIASKAEFRLGLSATPIFNYGGEIWNVLETLKPGVLGSYEEFATEWCSSSGEKAKLKDAPGFGSYARDAGLMLRRTRKEVGRELPDLIKAPHAIDCDPSAIQQIETSAMELARIILQKTERELAKGEQFRSAGEFDALIRQATGIAKAPHVAEFVRMLLDSGEKVVLYGWHRAVYDVWLDKLRDFAPAMYTGSESPNQKDEAKRKFCSGETPLIILSLRSGAGLDGLQYSGCRTVVFGELDWSPAVHEQCAGRVHRDGQNESVVAYYLIADSGADPVIADVLQLKKAQLEGLRDPSGPSGLERLDSGGAHVKRLASEFLRRREAVAAE